MSAATDAPTVAVSGEASAERNADETLIEEPPEDDEQAGPPVRYKIVSYGADYTVDGYLKRFDRGDLSIPKFQRGFIWTAPQASRLIESLILDLPVPGVFLFREPKTRKLIVVDGQQRLLSLRCFREEEIRGKRFRLSGVSDEQLCEKTYSALDETDRRAFKDAIIHATIFQQSEPTDDRSSVYQVFERLNTGGTALVDQEVRACVYRGRFNELLGELNREPHWRDLFGQVHRRKKDEELILRFLALYHEVDHYRRPMKQFLNGFMHRHLDLEEDAGESFRGLFKHTTGVANRVLGRSSLRPRGPLNVAVVDAVFVGIARRLDQGPIKDAQGLRSAHEALKKELAERELYQGSTTHEDRLTERIRTAIQAYAPVT